MTAHPIQKTLLAWCSLPANPDTNTDLKVSAVSYANLPGFSRNWQMIIADDPITDALYALPAADPSACLLAAQQQLAFPRSWTKLAAVLESEAQLYGIPLATQNRLNLLAEGKAVAVVTGQQVGFLGGPFYTFLKAYHCTRLARALEASLKLPVIPIFWLEGEDHDLVEISKSYYPDSSGEIKSVEFVPDKIIPNYEVGRYEVPLSAIARIHELASALQSVNAEAADLLEKSYQQTNLSGGIGRLLAKTLGERGLFIVEGMHTGLKQIANPLWQKVITSGSRLGEILSSRTAELEQNGWPTPLRSTPDSYLFYVSDKEHVRTPLSYDGTLRHPDGRIEKISCDDLVRRVQSGELSLSPKAALRPLYQDFVLPTIAYVGGPGELEYHAQLSPFYRELNVPAPSLFPRMTTTLTDGKTTRLMEKLDLTPERILTTSGHDLKKQFLHNADEGRTAELFGNSKRRIENIYYELKSELSKIDSTLKAATVSAAGKSLQPLGQLHQKAEKSLKQQHATSLSRLEKIYKAVKPNDSPSERVFGTAYYLLNYGSHRLLEILDNVPADGKAHAFIIAD
jgi:bacillithiol biosynthesis cysteine-adding enzyme BshC